LSAISANLDPVLDSKEFRAFKLKEIQPVTHDTKLFRFELPSNSSLGLPIASCVLTKAPGKDGKDVMRPYTPTSREGEKGYFDFVIKRYESKVLSYIVL
jgi:cytochrome-b5 reductase